MRLQESGEMYLEAIYVLSQNSKSVRAIDVGQYLGFSKPSVSRALGILKQGGFVESGESGFLTLTAEGEAVAAKIYERHRILTKVLMQLGVEEENASEDACRIEHVISDSTFEAIKEHMKRYAEN